MTHDLVEMDMVACMTVANVWISRNVAAFPIAISKNGKGYAKRPLTPHGHADATLDKSTANELFALASMDLREGEVLGVGIVPGPAGYAVADLDVHGDGKNGVQAADDLLMGIENTYAPVTISGGAHAWFTKPDPDQHITNGSPWARLGIDIRGDNGWTVAPGTITPWGSWAPITGTPTFDAIKPFPESLWNELVAHQCNGKVKVNLPTGPLPNPGDVALGDQLAGLLSDLGPWPDGDGEHRDRSRRFHYLVGEMKRHGHSIEDTTAVLTPWCNALDKYTGRVPEMVAASWAKVDGPPLVGDTTPGAVLTHDLDAIFGASATLSTLRQAAQSRMVGPLAVLGSVLAHVVAEVPPHWTLPPIVGSDASLNLAAGLVGGSGVGKSAAHACAREWVYGARQSRVARRIGPGSGEGLIQTFLRWDDNDKRMVLIDRPQALLYADEVAQVDAVQTRSGATFGPIIRTMWSGGEVGTANADQSRRRHLPAHSYRLCVVAGIQPHLAGILLDDADAGTPQRWLWLPAADPHMPDDAPDWPDPLGWSLPKPPASDTWTGRIRLTLPDGVAAFVRDQHRARQRTDGAEGLDGHMILTRLKTAAALTLLHDNGAITPEMWDLAGLLIDVSQTTRQACADAVVRRRAEDRRAQGHGDAQREAGAREARTQYSTRYAELLWRTVTSGASDGHSNMKHDVGAGCTRRCLTFALRHHPAADLDHAIAHAEAADWIEDRDSRWWPGSTPPPEGAP